MLYTYLKVLLLLLLALKIDCRHVGVMQLYDVCVNVRLIELHARMGNFNIMIKGLQWATEELFWPVVGKQ
jgi:hypothetical protein